MVVNETLPLCPDITLNVENEVSLSEPVEVGPFQQGIIFVRVFNVQGNPTIDVDVGISPDGYEDWDDHWVEVDSLSNISNEGIYATRLSNFGNWIRARFELGQNTSSEEATVLAWFVGDS